MHSNSLYKVKPVDTLLNTDTIDNLLANLLLYTLKFGCANLLLSLSLNLI